jgi:ATP-binding cassette, subfamily B, bacterial
MRELGTVFGSLVEVQAALNRIREILSEPVSNVFRIKNENLINNSDGEDIYIMNKSPKTETASTIAMAQKIAIEFSDVSFIYPNSENRVLDSISFQVQENNKFAIIGPTGEGKSTIAKLMSGLLSPKSGTIKIFGRELKGWEQSEFYNTIGFILQDPFLFTGTVASNIIYGNPRYQDFSGEKLIVNSENTSTPVRDPNPTTDNLPFSKTGSDNVDSLLQSDSVQNDTVETVSTRLISKLIQDIREHNLDSIIPNLEEFLKTEVNNNSQNISQGQKQIVNFIRVLLREPQILILDEATANLDTITETYLQTALDKLTNKATQIIIAHRQNTIKDADQIMLVGGGRISMSSNNNT